MINREIVVYVSKIIPNPIDKSINLIWYYLNLWFSYEVYLDK